MLVTFTMEVEGKEIGTVEREVSSAAGGDLVVRSKPFRTRVRAPGSRPDFRERQWYLALHQPDGTRSGSPRRKPFGLAADEGRLRLLAGFRRFRSAMTHFGWPADSWFIPENKGIRNTTVFRQTPRFGKRRVQFSNVYPPYVRATLTWRGHRRNEPLGAENKKRYSRVAN
jgi:hypothetical protein